MAVNGGVNVKEDCASRTESDWFDSTEEEYESFENISPCKKEDLQSPAIAGHGVFHPVMTTDQCTAYDDTVSMLIINAADYPTQLEATNGELVAAPIDIQVEPPSEGDISDDSMQTEPVSLVDSTVSSVSLADEMADGAAPSDMDLLENGAPKPLPMTVGLEELPMAQKVVSTHLPKNFLVSAESTPLKPYEQNVLMSKGYLHNYLKENPTTAPIGEMEISLERSTQAASILCDADPHQSVEECHVSEGQVCQALPTSFENGHNLGREDLSEGEGPAAPSENVDSTPTRAKQTFQESSTINGYTGETDGGKGNNAHLSVTEKPQSDDASAEEPLSGYTAPADSAHREFPSGSDFDHGVKMQNQDGHLTAEMIAMKPEDLCLKLDRGEGHADLPAENRIPTKHMDHFSPPDCEDIVPDVRYSWQSAMAPGPRPETEGNLTSISLDNDTFETKLTPASSLWTTERDGAVRLRMDATGPAAEPPITLHQMFQRTIRHYGDRPALAMKNDGIWETMTYLEYHQQCRAAAKGFLKLGLERFHGVGILGFNSPEWFISDIGAIMAGGFAVGIYTTNSPEACQYVAENCDANILVVENHRQLAKILQIQDQLPHLKAIIQYHDELKEPKPNLYTWKEFLQLGTEIPDSQLDEIIALQQANQCCTLIYTSGTTGQPKGAMLSHDNLTWVVKQAGKMLGLGSEQEVIVSYLPLSHIAAQVLDIWIPMCFGGTTYFADPDALKGSLVTTLREVRPTGFLGVPRVWEKIQEKMKSRGAKGSMIQRKVASWAKAIGLQASYNRMNGISSMPWGYTVSNMLVFRRVHAALGLDRCSRCYTGAAPITKDTLEYFMSLNLPVLELYGMSESTGPHTLSTLSAFRIMSTGKEIPGCKTLIHKPEEDGTGEICFWGRHIFMGYLNMEDKTKEALDEEGWLHSGDLGKLDENGFLYITGRIKELIITAGGENIPPVPIEDAIKEELPIVSNAMLIGDKMKFLSMLLTLKCKADPDTGEPQDDLSPEALQFCQQLGSRATQVSEVVGTKDQAVYKAIQDGIDRVNRRATSNAQRVQKWTILDKDFSLPGGELGPTMKLKRPVVSKMYTEQIENFYKE